MRTACAGPYLCCVPWACNLLTIRRTINNGSPAASLMSSNASVRQPRRRRTFSPPAKAERLRHVLPHHLLPAPRHCTWARAPRRAVCVRLPGRAKKKNEGPQRHRGRGLCAVCAGAGLSHQPTRRQGGEARQGPTAQAPAVDCMVCCVCVLGWEGAMKERRGKPRPTCCSANSVASRAAGRRSSAGGRSSGAHPSHAPRPGATGTAQCAGPGTWATAAQPKRP